MHCKRHDRYFLYFSADFLPIRVRCGLLRLERLLLRHYRRIENRKKSLFTSQELSLLESGKRLSNKLLQDAIVERLGIGAEDYELFLGAAEYRRWEERQRIFHQGAELFIEGVYRICS